MYLLWNWYFTKCSEAWHLLCFFDLENKFIKEITRLICQSLNLPSDVALYFIWLSWFIIVMTTVEKITNTYIILWIFKRISNKYFDTEKGELFLDMADFKTREKLPKISVSTENERILLETQIHIQSFITQSILCTKYNNIFALYEFYNNLESCERWASII